jgi:hypothetical protein
VRQPDESVSAEDLASRANLYLDECAQKAHTLLLAHIPAWNAVANALLASLNTRLAGEWLTRLIKEA